MVKQIKLATAKTLSTADKIWNVLLIISQSTATVILALEALNQTRTVNRAIIVSVACVLAANVILTLFRLQKETH